MPLQGTLETFGISEIFQLVSQQGKTGTLEIQSDEGVARLRFADGHLIEAWSDARSPSELIGSLLVRARLITQAQLDHALEVQRQSLRPLGDILIRTGALRVWEFRQILTLQHRETVYRMLFLRRGSFFFRSEPVEIEEGVSAPMDVGTLLMEGFRQIDEWPKLRERIPSENRVVVQTEGAAASLDPEAERILSLVDGLATVRQIVDFARLGEFAGWSALARLLDLGAIQLSDVARRLAAPPKPNRALAAAALDTLLAVALLLAALLSVGLLGSETPLSRTAAAVGEARREARTWDERFVNWAGGEAVVRLGRARR